MGKASKVVTLALIGTGLGGLGYAAFSGGDDESRSYTSSTQPGHRGHGSGYYGGGYYGGSGYRSSSGSSSSSYRSTSSSTSRGGFGSTGHSSSSSS